ncbi:Zn-ribbon domain-containing OB-fold protein [Sheuella amnicola]|uniref:Zn-ribbon domain-containing OB-fold protein n=1 Tax=Sheuella amnicola TaxID=2707330 RepID=UPI00288337C0|nr:OB-fold domain-containing protein [Sheuella amnicola]
MQWTAPTGFATVYSTTTVRRQEGDYNVSLIELEEGPRLMSRVEGIDPDEVRIGLKVRTHILQREDGPMLVFVKRENIEH